MPDSGQRILLVDLHGTTVPTAKPLSRAFANAFKLAGSKAEMKRIERGLIKLYFSDMGLPLEEKARRGLKIIDGKEHSVQEGIRTADNAWREFLKLDLKPYPAIPQFLRRMKKQGWRVFASTDNPRWVAEGIVRKLGMQDVFEEVLAQDTGKGAHKVEKHLNYLAQKFGIFPADFKKRFVYFGDSLGEMREARRLGAIGIGRTTSYPAKKMKAAGAERIVRGKEGLAGRIVTAAGLRRTFRKLK